MIHDRTVLIAEGDPALRELLRKRLSTLDVFAEAVADGREALQKLEERSYAMLILDLALPLVASGPILDRVRSLPDGQRPMILVTAERGVPHALDVDLVQIVLRKPFDVRQIAEVVASCLRALRARRKASLALPDEIDDRDSVRLH
jgi:CheY-like chemotaxis protein